MDKTRSTSLFYFALSAVLISTVVFMFLLGVASFAFGLSIAPWHFPVAVVSALIALFFRARHYFKAQFAQVFALLVVAYVLVMVVSMVVAVSFFDISYNGQAYHQETIIQLKEGWSPFHHPYSLAQVHSGRVDLYPKGAEIPQAALYACFDKIEIGKATNLILMLASVFLGLALMYRLPNLSRGKAVVLALLAALNPVVVVQLLTFYVDGQLASLLLMLVLMFGLLVFEFDKWVLSMFFKITLLALNIKFSAVLFVGIFILGFLLLLRHQHRRANFRHFFITSLLAVFIGLCGVGYNPYITNTIAYEDPFFPQSVNHRTDVQQWLQPKGIEQLDRVRALLWSTFARTSDSGDTPQLKVPFAVDIHELGQQSHPDTRIGGLGVFFGGILLAVLLLFVRSMWGSPHPPPHAQQYVLWLLVALVASILVIPQAWWVRFVPQLWLVPLAMLVYIDTRNSPARPTTRVLGGVAYLLLVTNVVLISCAMVISNMLYTQRIHWQLSLLQGQAVYVDFRAYAANRVRLQEHHIAYKPIPAHYQPAPLQEHYLQCIIPQVKIQTTGLPLDFDLLPPLPIGRAFTTCPLKLSDL